MSQQLSIGRVVHYRLPDKHGLERLRPAIVVQAFGACANLTVFLDGLNDGRDEEDAQALESAGLDLGRPQQFKTKEQRLRAEKRKAEGREVPAPPLPRFLTASAGSVSEGTGVGAFRWPVFVPPVGQNAKPSTEGHLGRALASREVSTHPSRAADMLALEGQDRARAAARVAGEKRDAQLTPAEFDRAELERRREREIGDTTHHATMEEAVAQAVKDAGPGGSVTIHLPETNDPKATAAETAPPAG